VRNLSLLIVCSYWSTDGPSSAEHLECFSRLLFLNLIHLTQSNFTYDICELLLVFSLKNIARHKPLWIHVMDVYSSNWVRHAGNFLYLNGFYKWWWFGCLHVLQSQQREWRLNIIFYQVFALSCKHPVSRKKQVKTSIKVSDNSISANKPRLCHKFRFFGFVSCSIQTLFFFWYNSFLVSILA